MRTQTQVSLSCIVLALSVLPAICYPQTQQNHFAPQYIPVQIERQDQFIPSLPRLDEESRRFAEKPNSVKKVVLDDIDEDIQTNQISDTGFSWSNMLGMVMQMLFNNNSNNGPSKSDDLDANNGLGASPWANTVSIFLRVVTALLGGYQNDGIDKVDNGASPMQNVLAAVFTGLFGAKDPDQVNTMAKQAGEFINIVVNLLDALKTSFSHRSISARSIGRKDSMSDAAVAGIAMLKGYAKTYKSSDNICMQKYLCEANRECLTDIGGSSVFCQLGTYAASYLLERSSGSPFDVLYEAGRKGRSGLDCKQVYLECNEV